MPYVSDHHQAVNQFQSAPGREAGRCTRSKIRVSGGHVFQSAPGREAGRCSTVTDAWRKLEEFQSAPGREAGRCDAPHHAIDG